MNNTEIDIEHQYLATLLLKATKWIRLGGLVLLLNFILLGAFIFIKSTPPPPPSIPDYSQENRKVAVEQRKAAEKLSLEIKKRDDEQDVRSEDIRKEIIKNRDEIKNFKKHENINAISRFQSPEIERAFAELAR